MGNHSVHLMILSKIILLTMVLLIFLNSIFMGLPTSRTNVLLSLGLSLLVIK